MSLFDAFSYDGKRALVVGGATGMGAATAEVVRDGGADVVVMDRAPVGLDGVASIELDLSDKGSIEAAVDACGDPVDALFSCAGVADGTPGIERINFLGHRHLIDRLLAGDHLRRGSAIALISSSAGLGWEANLDLILEFLAIEDFDEAARWCVDNERAHYMWTKQVINAYVAQQAMPLMARGIRINATLPGPTNTPLARANAETWLTFGEDYRELTGTEPSTPLEQAYPLAFLCSDAASGISGITLVTDAGFLGAGVSRSHEPTTEAIRFLRGEYGPL